MGPEHTSDPAQGFPGASETAWALHLAAAHTALETARADLLYARVFRRKELLGSPHKEDLQNRRILLDSESHKICTILWKESAFVSELELPDGMQKAFGDGEITQRGLAVMLSVDPRDVARLNFLVQSVVEAGSYLGLIQKERYLLNPER